MSSDANTGNVIGGHKATLSNEHVGAEAKAHSAKILQEEYGIKVTKDGDEYTVEDDSIESGEKNIGNVIGGHKSVLSNPNSSEEAKEHAKEVLSELDDKGNTTSTGSGEHEKDSANVERGLKATLSNPRTSDEAKEHAQERLDKGDY